VVSIKDIAKKLGVSPSTVSFVLNGKAKEMRISAEMTKKIQQTAEDAGYHPNQVAVSLRTGKSRIIALIVDTISGSFFSSLARTIEQEAQDSGYRVIYCSTGNNIKKGGDLIQMMHQYQVDGYLIIPSAGMEKDIELLLDKNKPLVLMDSYFPGMAAPYVLVDNYGGVTQGMEHLIQKGYKKIAFVCNDVDMVQMHERKKAYEATLRKHKLRFSRQLMCETKYTASKEEVVNTLKVFLEKNKPEAVFFAANYLGVYGLESIKSLGWSIPKDIAVVCFDDLDIFNLYPPGITSIRQPIEEIAKKAIQLLLQLMNDSSKPKKKGVQLEPQMILRQST
jgi:LacI family transcriptional regulator